MESAKFYKVALDGDALDPIVKEKPCVLSLFQIWLRCGSLIDLDLNMVFEKWDLLIELYIFAEKYGIPGLQNSAIDVIILKQVTFMEVPLGLAHLVQSSVTDWSPLLHLFIDWTIYLWGGDDRWLQRQPQDWHQSVSLISRIELNRPKEGYDLITLRSRYHVNTAGESNFKEGSVSLPKVFKNTVLSFFHVHTSR